MKLNDSTYNRIAAAVRADGEKCESEDVKRLFESLDGEGKAWLRSAPASEVKAWATDVLINTQPAAEH